MHLLFGCQGHGDVRNGNNKTELEAPNLGKIATALSPRHRHGGTSNGGTPKRISRQSMGSDRSIDHSPLHPNHQPSKVSGKSSGGFSSPSEGDHGLAPSTTGRSRLRSVTKGNDSVSLLFRTKGEIVIVCHCVLSIRVCVWCW